MTSSRLDCHFFKGAYLIGLNHVIFYADKIRLKGCLLNWAYKWPTEQGLIILCLLNWAYKWPTEQGLKRMTPSCIDCHFLNEDL